MIHPAEFLGKDQREEVIRSLSAVFGVVFQADESELGHIGNHLVQRHHLLAFPLVDAGLIFSSMYLRIVLRKSSCSDENVIGLSSYRCRWPSCLSHAS